MSLWHHTPIVREIGHAAVYYPLRVFFTALVWLPRPLLELACRAIAGVARLLGRREIRAARENLLRAFPDKSAAERAAIVDRVYRHFSLMFRDTVLLWRRRGEPDTAAAFLVDPDPAELDTVRALQAEGKGVILISGHLGNWEVAGCALSRVLKINGFSRNFRNPGIKRFISRIRTAFGQNVIFRDNRLEPMLECLARNECLALLPDKHLRSARMVVRFFGRRVFVPSGPAVVCYRSGAPMVVCGAFREGDTSRFTVEIAAVVRPDPSARKGAEIHRITQAYIAGLEQLIRRHPGQWIWFHERWKRQHWLPPEKPAATAGESSRESPRESAAEPA